MNEANDLDYSKYGTKCDKIDRKFPFGNICGNLLGFVLKK
jgi:hypothetical protein